MNCSKASRAAALTLLLSGAPARAAVQIKFATLAPEGTQAMKLMRAIDEELRAKTGGELGFKFYAGGRQGDEKDMVRKIQVGQLHAGGFTGVGLGEISPMTRILDAPWLLRDGREVDHVYKSFAADFEKALADAGYVLLGWTEVGFVHVFSNAPVRSPEDMRRLKIWVWEGDPIAEAAFEAVGVHPIPLSITDVNTSLQTGLIDAVYSAPLYAIALQWHEKTKFVHSLPMANASGAVLLSKKVFDSLPAARRELLLATSRKHLGRLNELTRDENRRALQTLKAAGLTVTDPAPGAAAAFEAAGAAARRKLAGRLYPKQLLERVEKAVADLRAKAPKKG